MANPDLGTKRTCSSCGARFYDLNKKPVVCPKCEHAFIPDILLPSKEVHVEAKKPVEKPAAEPVEAEEAESDDVEVVSLTDIEDDADDADDTDDDEVAAIKDVDLGNDDDVDDDDEAEDDAFLEDDDEESDVTGLLGGGIAADKDEI